MRDGHALGGAGGARGVDQVRDVVGGGGGDRGSDGGARLCAQSGIPEVDQRQVAPGQPIGQRRLGDGGDGRGVVEHEVHAGRRQRRVDREVRRPGFEHREHGDDGVGRAFQQQRHPRAWADTARGQHVRQPIRGLVEFPVGQRHVPVAHRHRLGRADHLRGEQRRHRHRVRCGPGQHTAVADIVQAGAFGVVEHVHRRQPPPGIGGHCGQHPPEPFDQGGDGVGVEHVGAVLHRSRDPAGFVCAAAAFT